jgi:putative endonuclease
MFTVYILFSKSHNRFYIGQTSDLEQRIERHNSGSEKSTSPYLPWKVVCSINKNSRSEAMMLEKKLKNLNTEDLKTFINKYGSQTGVAR